MFTLIVNPRKSFYFKGNQANLCSAQNLGFVAVKEVKENRRSLADTAGGINLLCRIELAERELTKLLKGNTLVENKDPKYNCKKGQSKLRLLK